MVYIYTDRRMSVYVQLMLTTLAKSSLKSQGQPNRNLGEVFHLSVLVKMPQRTWEKLHHSLWVWLERPDRLLIFLFLLSVYTSCTKRQFFCCENVIYACDELWSDSFPSLNISLFYLPLALLSPPGVLIHAPPTPPIGEKTRSICEPTSVLISLCSCVKPQPKAP